jgi:hypothetical protein
MNLFGGLGGLKTKLKGIYQSNAGLTGTSTEYEGNNLEYDDLQHTLHILQDENKILKNKVRLLENSVLGNNDDKNSTQSQFSNLFKDLKSTFTYTHPGDTKQLLSGTGHDSNTTISEFKKFLCDNLLFYNSFDEDDVEYLNNIHLSGDDWEKNKDLFLFKQKILEKNYNEMFKNMTVAREIDDLHKKKYGAVEGGKNLSNVSSQNYDNLRRPEEVVNSNLLNSVNVKSNTDKYNTNNDLNGADQIQHNLPSTTSHSVGGVPQPTKQIASSPFESKPVVDKVKTEKELKQKEIENVLLKDLISVSTGSKDDTIFNLAQKSINKSEVNPLPSNSNQSSSFYLVNSTEPRESLNSNKVLKENPPVFENNVYLKQEVKEHTSNSSISNENTTRISNPTFNNLLNLDEEDDNIDLSSVLKKNEKKNIEKYENVQDEEKVLNNIFNFRNSATNDKILNTNTFINTNTEKKIINKKSETSNKDEDASQNLLSSNYIF